jgi:hypothetical protein
MDWRDRPIRPDDPFIPVGPCRVSSTTNVWLFELDGTGGGRWARVPLGIAQKGSAPDVPEAGWSHYERIVWYMDDSTYRLRIVADEPRGQLTGVVEDVEGEWTSESE